MFSRATMYVFIFFFFQAEDGIRDWSVTGVQTCALPIFNEDYAIRLIEAQGFRLVAKSQVNANPKDTKDYEQGVWTLPPTYRLGDKDRDKYAAIGESDRFTLRFVKPLK